MEKARSMMMQAKSDPKMWAEAVNTSVYLINRCPAKKIPGTTPEEVWSGKKVDLSHLRVFGSPAYAHVPSQKRRKLDAKAKELIFVGYSDTSKAYRLLDPETHNIEIARTVDFFEHRILSHQPSHSDIPEGVTSTAVLPFSNEDGEDDVASRNAEISSEDGSSDAETDDAESPDSAEFAETDYEPSVQGSDVTSVNESDPNRRYPVRNRTPNSRYNDYVMLSVNDDFEPETIEEALSCADSAKWRQAILEELKAFEINNAWTLVDKPDSKNVIKNKWVFKIKRNDKNEIIKYKARLVAKGCSQKYGVDFNETFAPVVRQSTIRLLLSIATELDLQAEHLDVATAFLNGDISEEIFMYQPDGFPIGDKNEVCKLNRAIYGLKQASRSWFLKAKNLLLDLKFKQSKHEQCVFYKNSKHSFLIVALYVDDFFLFFNDKKGADELKTALKNNFQMKDLGPISCCLGIEVKRDRRAKSMKLTQTRYINKVLSKFNMVDCKIASTPLENKCKLNPAENNIDVPFQELIGSLMYLSVCTRPDISHSVSYLSQFNLKHGKEHWLAAKRVLRYLKGTVADGLLYKSTGHTLTGFADADWGNNFDGRSFTGFSFVFGNAAVSWECHKQNSTQLSSTHAELVAITDATREAIYLKSLLNEIFSVSDKFVDRDGIILYNDSQSAQKMVLNPNNNHKKSKHIVIKYNFVKEQVDRNVINLMYLSTEQMPVDMLTKSLGATKHTFCKQVLLGSG